jgi:general secretion pathway protein D
LGVAAVALASCSVPYPPDKIDPAGNLTRRDYLELRQRGGDAPETDKDDKKDDPKAPPIPEPPAPKHAPPPEKKVSVAVTDDVPLRDVLLELGREGGVNLELDPRIEGGVIFTAQNQPFHDVLHRLCALAGLRWKQEGHYLRIELDEPYPKSYPLHYLNLARKTTSETTIATNVFDQDVGGNNSTRASSSGSSDNNSTSKVTATGDSDFWGELDKSLNQILTSTGKTRSLLRKNADDKAKTGNERPPASYSLDRQAGLLSVFATQAQHEAVQDYLDKLRAKATAQVLIEARIVEVALTDGFKSGIDWTTLFKGAVNASSSFGAFSAATSTDGAFSFAVSGKDFSGTLDLLRSFGTTRILSSPRLTALNNQPAILKVARNEVYFITTAQFSTTTSSTGAVVTGTPIFTSTPRTVPVGLVMTVQPSIDADKGLVTMTLRPTISRILDYVSDPSISLNAAQAGISTDVESKIPVLAVREMDSVLQLHSGEVAVMGGLMQDTAENTENGVPPFDLIPIVDNLAKSRNNSATTSELVILLRATILDRPIPDGADADLYQRYTPDPRPLPMPLP